MELREIGPYQLQDTIRGSIRHPPSCMETGWTQHRNNHSLGHRFRCSCERHMDWTGIGIGCFFKFDLRPVCCSCNVARINYEVLEYYWGDVLGVGSAPSSQTNRRIRMKNLAGYIRQCLNDPTSSSPERQLQIIKAWAKARCMLFPRL